MSEDSLKKQIEKHGFTVGDINYIVNYMAKESLSPQLAMRRIKSYDALEKKMIQKSEAHKMKIEHLSKELEVKTQALEEANDKLEELGAARQREDEIRNNLESKSEMLDAELEELKNQLQMIQIMQTEQPPERSPESEAIAKSINHIINEIKLIIIEYEEVTTLFLPLVTALTEALADPEGFVFTPDDLIAAIEDFMLLNGPQPQSTTPEMSSQPRNVTPEISSPPQMTPQTAVPSIEEAPSPVQTKPLAEEIEDIVPSWKRIEEQKEEPKPEPVKVKPQDLIKQNEDDLISETEEQESETEETEEEIPSTGQLSPSQIIKQRQKALAEREARRKEEEAKIEALKQAALKKASEEKSEEVPSPETVEHSLASAVETKPKSVEPEPVKPTVAEPTEPKPKPVEPKPAEVVKEKTEPVKKAKPSKPEPKVDKKTKQVLLTFKDFVSEAKSTKNFNERIKLISDQDAAYEVLGGIGLSQFYSYATKPIQAKDELLKLLDDWIANGPPR